MTRNGKTGPMSKEASHIFEKIQRGREAEVRCICIGSPGRGKKRTFDKEPQRS